MRQESGAEESNSSHFLSRHTLTHTLIAHVQIGKTTTQSVFPAAANDWLIHSGARGGRGHKGEVADLGAYTRRAYTHSLCDCHHTNTHRHKHTRKGKHVFHSGLLATEWEHHEGETPIYLFIYLSVCLCVKLSASVPVLVCCMMSMFCSLS